MEPIVRTAHDAGGAYANPFGCASIREPSSRQIPPLSATQGLVGSRAAVLSVHGRRCCITVFAMDETVGGVPVTEKQIKAWQQQARAGLETEGLRSRGRPRLGKSGESPVIPVRMDAELLEALTERAEHDGVSRSEAIREAVRAWTRAA